MILLQFIINGITIGGGYALIGIGLTMIFGIMNVVNFAHGEMYMLGAFFLYSLIALFGVNFYLSFILAVGLVMIVAFLFEKGVLKGIRNRPIDIVMLAMIGFSMLLQNLAMLIWSPVPVSIPSPFQEKAIIVGGIYLLPSRITVIVVALILVIATHLLLKKTRMGKAMRATFMDQEAASLMGISSNKVFAFTFTIGAGLAAAAGALLGPIFTVHPYIGNLANLKAFAIVIIGGLGSFVGAVVAGFMLGIFESLGAVYVSSGYQDAVSFLMLIIILIIKPTGLFGKMGQAR